MTDLERMAAYHVNEHTPLIKRDNRTPEGYYYEPDDITAREAADPSGLSEAYLLTDAERIARLEARIAALERRLNDSDGGK